MRIPAEVHDLYRGGRTSIGRYELIPAGQILAVHLELLANERRLAEDPRRWAGLVRRSLSHPGAVCPFMFHPLWVPILSDPGYHGRTCVDLAPGPNGHIGQLVHSGLLVAHSAADLLTTRLRSSSATPHA